MLLARPISYASKWYMDFLEIFNVLLESPCIILLVLIGIEHLLYLCVTLSKNVITCCNLFSGVKFFVILLVGNQVPYPAFDFEEVAYQSQSAYFIEKTFSEI